MTSLTDEAFMRILGQEIRRVRDEAGLTRAQLVEQLASGIGDRTLLSYEHGVRALTVARFVEICRTLDIAANEVLATAIKKAGDLSGLRIRVSLKAVAVDENEEFKSVQRWARRRLKNHSSREVVLSPATVRELAVALNLTHAALAGYLIQFTAAPSENGTTDTTDHDC